MKRQTSIVSVLCLAGAIALGAASARGEGIVSKEALGDGNYCHMKFESIRESTLGEKQPLLNDSGSADIVDFYGPCHHDPLGNEIRAQELDSRRRRIEDFSE
jgi:hypothetical protein